MLRKICLVVVLTLFLTSSAFAADAHFVWTPNTETNLAGYKIYYGTAPR